MRPGRKGEVVLESIMDAHYARMGALATRNTELFSAVNAARKERDRSTGEAVLAAEFRQGVIDGLDTLAEGFTYGLRSTVTFTYPQLAATMAADIETPQRKRK